MTVPGRISLKSPVNILALGTVNVLCVVCRRRSASKLPMKNNLSREHRAVRLEAEVVPLERRLVGVDAGEGVRLGVELLVAEEFEDRAVERVAARLGDDVHLRALVPELRRVDAGLDLELLDRVDRRQGDVVLKFGSVLLTPSSV